jgi:hypothetical protein
MERKFNDTTNIKQLEFKGTTKKNLIPLLIDESYMFYDNKTMKEYIANTACYCEQKIDKLSNNK